MNVLLGMACIVFAYRSGMIDQPARVGGIEPASPAYEAGLRAGDEIVSIGGRGDLSWNSMTLKVVLTGQGQSLHFEVRRPETESHVGVDVQPVRAAGSDRPTIGVRSSSSLNIGLFAPFAGMKDPPEYPRTDSSDGPRLLETLVAVAPPGQERIAVRDDVHYKSLLAQFQDQLLVHHVEKREGTPDSPGKTVDQFEITLPPVNFVDLGLRMKIEPINGIRKDSPAERAGFRIGDKIVKVNGRDDFDPMRLPSLCYEHAGKPMTFEVLRAAADGSSTTQSITVTPDATTPWTDPPMGSGALDVAGLGLCYPVLAHVQSVRPDSPAARAGIIAGNVITSITFVPRKEEQTEKGKTDAKGGKSSGLPMRSDTINLDESSKAWVKVFWALQESRYEMIRVSINNGNKPLELKPEADSTWFFPERGLLFLPLWRKLPPQSIGAALHRGWDDTIENILSIYGTIRGLVLGRLGPKGVAGPIRIATIAYAMASAGLVDLVHFLGILSINLAVINFLPIPPLDGGQMLFLIAEKVRGRPLSDSALTAGIIVGIFLVIALIIFVCYQDVAWIIGG
jgi:regulator of sigma E protease